MKMTNTTTDDLQSETTKGMNGLPKEERVRRLVPLLKEVLALLGEDPDRKGLQRTPERWAEALLTYTQGTAASPENHLRVIFEMDDDDYPVGSDDMIIVDNIHFTSTCEHHMAPFRGTAHVAYIPNPGEPHRHRPFQDFKGHHAVREAAADPGAHDATDREGDR